MSNRVKVGIIGTGTIGTVHAEVLQAVPEAKIVAMCDIDSAKLADRAKRFGVTSTFADYHELLKSDVQAVVICTPNCLHKPMAIAALRAGKDVLVEKPMTMNTAEATEIVQVVKETGKLLNVGNCTRQNRQIQVVKEYIDSGFFGHIYHMRAVLIRRRGIPGLGGWFTTKAQSGGGPLIDCGVHWFDLAMYLSGYWKPTTVSASSVAKFGPRMRDYAFVDMWGPPKFEGGVFDVEDYSTGFVRFEGGATMVFDIAWAANAQDQAYIEIMGDKAGVRVLEGGATTIFTEDHKKVADLSPKFQPGEGNHQAQDRRFIHACLGKHPVDVPAEQGLITVKLIETIYASSQAQKEIAITW